MAALRFKAEARLYGAVAAIHIEHKNDEVFWRKVLKYAYPEGKFRFIATSRSASGNFTCGCTQCMQYHKFLDKRFWIAIDSDYRYLREETGIDAAHYVLQTYTYSFENHFCFGQNMNRAYRQALGLDPSVEINPKEEYFFDFEAFLREYSFIIYPLMVWQLYLEKVDPNTFPKNVFHRLLGLNFPKDFWKNNGEAVLDIMKSRSWKLQKYLKKKYPEADYTWFEARCNELGVTRDNSYLFVRGHNLYDSMIPMAKLLVTHAKSVNKKLKGGNFENILNSFICFGKYKEINWLLNDGKFILDK